MSSPVTYLAGFIPEATALDYFNQLHDDLAWVKHDTAPRQEYWANPYDMPYTYGRGLGERTYQAQPSHLVIDTLRLLITQHTGFELEGCFLNLYETKQNWLGWHADDDAKIDHHKPIAVVTLGGERLIQYRAIANHMDKDEAMLASGSLFMMHPGMQFTHEHRIPKAGREVRPRISLTYRGLIPPECPPLAAV